MYQNIDLRNVTLGDSEFKHRRDLVKQYIKELDVERLMHNFRINAGIESSAKPYGGWEAPDVGIRGHFVGHYLSTCAKFGYIDNESDLIERTKCIVHIMRECQREDGYLSAFPEQDIDELESENDNGAWAPYYTFHKIIQGLLDAYYYANIKEAINIATKFACYIKKRFDNLSYWKIDRILNCTKLNPKNEFGGIGDCLYTLYEYTHDENMIELAKIFDRSYFLEPLERGEDVLNNLHSNTHLPMISAAIHRYELLGEEKYKKLSFTFYEFLRGRLFANGNSSSGAPNGIPGRTSSRAEHWGEYGYLVDKLTGGESESCCAHNTEKILSKLFKYKNDIRYLDHLEELKYNSVLNSASSITGVSQYHQPMGTGAKKVFSTKEDSFWCCTGSGIEAMSELANNIYFIDGNKILINGFISSTVQMDGVKLIQESLYPDKLKSTIKVETKEEKMFSIILKTSHIDELYVNNEKVDLEYNNDYTEIRRSFQSGDTITIKIKADLNIVYLKGSGSIAAIKYGNILLAQVGDKEYITEINERKINKVIKKSEDDKLEFYIENEQKEKIKFIPLFRIEDETYTVYINLTKSPVKERAYQQVKDGSEAYSD